MDYRKRLIDVLTLSLFLLPLFSQAQMHLIKARPTQALKGLRLSEQFSAFGTYEINTQEIVNLVREEDFTHLIAFDLPGYGRFVVELFENPLQASNYLLSVKSANGISHHPANGVIKTFTGNLKGGQYLVSLTLDEGYISGFIELPKHDFLHIEPLRRYIKGAGKDEIIVYRASESITPANRACEVKQHTERAYGNMRLREDSRLLDDCRVVQIAFANDWLMYTEQGQDIVDVENHNLSVINDVQNNYDTEFADDLDFLVTQIWISTCSACDPWTSSTNAGSLLDDFTDWGPTGFSNQHDVANLWTDRDFNGPTIGISWLEAVCTPFRYLTTQDFSSNSGQLRTLLAHELGHNFGSDHDPAGSSTIMAPSLVVTNTWSTSSINQINNYLDDINCLSICSASEPPMANFSADEELGCASFDVHFFDESSGSPTAWEWTFPGGTPSSSTQQNPTITYHTAGVYDVMLEVTNSAGSNTLVRQDFIEVLNDPEADFIYDQDELLIIFTNLSQNGDSWFWEFGDGGTSTLEHPIHHYDQDGEYTVSLTVTSDCGVDVYTEVIEVFVPPVADFSYSTNTGCAPLTVQFFNESSSNVQFILWLFPGGTPASSVQMNPVVTYQNPGEYDVTLIVENPAGTDELVINDLIEVNTVPEADFGFTINGLTVQFTNTSVDADTYLWSFGDGTTSTATHPDHIYLQGGSYQVQLTATNECGSDGYLSTVVLTSAPVAGFITSVSSGCPPLTVTYTSTSTGSINSYNWSFPGGIPSSSTQQMPTVVYQNPGVYDAQLIVSNAVGADTLFREDLIQVFQEVSSGFTADINGASVSLENTSTGATLYNWLIDGQTFGSEDVTYMFEEDGDYPVRLIATGPCGSDTAIQLLQIVTPPTAGLASNVTSGCQPLTVQFFNTSSSNAETFAWEFEGGIPAMSSEENPVVQYSQPGTYDVTLTVWSEAGMDILAITDLIQVSPVPVSVFTTIQDGLEIEFVNNSVSANQFFWVFGDGSTSSEPNPTHAYTEFGTYQVSLIAQNNCGADTMTIFLQLSTAPVPMFTVDQTHGCVPFEVQFTNMSQNNPDLWEWSFPGGLPDTTNLPNPTIVYTEPGVYPVTLRVSNAGGSQILVRDDLIYVEVPPVAQFSSFVDGQTVVFTNNSLGGSEYLWSFGDGHFDTIPNPEHTYTQSGAYEVKLLVINPCSTDSIVQEVIVEVTSLDNPEQQLDVMIYPNPNSGEFYILLEGATEAFEVEITDVLGNFILSSYIEPDPSGPYEVDIADAPPGVYSVSVRKNDFRKVFKMILR